jgi:hypothetical protein
MEKVVLYHLNDVIREGKLIPVSKEMPKIGIDEVLIGVQTDPIHGRAFEIDNPELYGRFYNASGSAWFCSATFSLLYTLPREKAEKILAVKIESEGKTYVGQEMVHKSLRPTLISHINGS